MWATRIMFESQMHPASSFITLTYSPENLPFPPSLVYKHFQDFMKRLRFKFRDKNIRFYMCGEYGEQNRRPHYHACIFGLDFEDRVLYKRLPSGFDLFISSDLNSLWPFGFSSVADLSFESAAYVARYCLKKVTGDLADAHYSWVDPDSGEVFQLEPEFAHMSLKPGIGGSWYDKYRSDVSADYVVINGVKCKPPRYFDRLLRRFDRSSFDDMKEARAFAGYLRRSDNSDSRLRVKEIVQRAALKRLSPRGDL